MKFRNLFGGILVSLTLMSLGCDFAHSLTATKIKDIVNHPRDYADKEISVYGTVTNSVSLLAVKYYEIQDDTGNIKVFTDKLLPNRGEKLKVTGRTVVVEVGSERWVVLRENKEAPPAADRRDNTRKATSFQF